MKNNQKGSIVPILIIIIVILVLGGGYYIQTLKKNVSDSSGWKTYSDSQMSFEYPTILHTTNDMAGLVLSHSTVYRHPDPCDFKGDALPLENLTDFHISIGIVNQNLEQYVKSTTYPGWDYVSKNPFKSGSWSGYMVTPGVEGCGEELYYLTISQNKTLVIKRPLVTEFSSIIADYQKYSSLPGAIVPSQADEYFSRILSSLRIK